LGYLGLEHTREYAQIDGELGQLVTDFSFGFSFDIRFGFSFNMQVKEI